MQITYYPAGSNPAPQSPSPPLQEAVVAESDKLPQSPLPQGQDFVVTNLDKLPVELLEMIVLDLDDLGDLYSLVTAYKRAHYLYLSDPQGVASKMLTRSNVGGHQIRSLLLSIWLSQQSQSYVPGSRSPNEAHGILHQPAIDNLLTQFYTMGDQDIKHRLAILMGTMGPIGFLKEATSIAQNITEAEESLISTMLRKTNAEIESVMKTRQQRDISIRQDKMKGVRGDTEYLSTFSSIKSPTTRTPASVAEQSRLAYPFSKVPPSSTEIHRIRRAFWRLWLFFELYHHAGQPPGRRYVRVDPDSYPQGFGPVDFFFSPLALWEHEEMECAYYHLCYQAFLWRKQCPHCWRFFLPDILTKHLSECDWLPTAQKPSYTIQPDQLWTFEYANYLHRCRKWDREERASTPTGDKVLEMEAMKQLTTLNDGPSAGWSFLVHNRSVRGAFVYEYIWRHGDKPMGYFINWGYCMWDLSRMQAWHLIDDPDNGIKAEVDWWTDGRIRRETCEHCRYRYE